MTGVPGKLVTGTYNGQNNVVLGNGDYTDPTDNFANGVWNHLYIFADPANLTPAGPNLFEAHSGSMQREIGDIWAALPPVHDCREKVRPGTGRETGLGQKVRPGPVEKPAWAVQEVEHQK